MTRASIRSMTWRAWRQDPGAGVFDLRLAGHRSGMDTSTEAAR